MYKISDTKQVNPYKSKIPEAGIAKEDDKNKMNS